jgi:hypothetical protein
MLTVIRGNSGLSDHRDKVATNTAHASISKFPHFNPKPQRQPNVTGKLSPDCCQQVYAFVLSLRPTGRRTLHRSGYG